MLVVFPFLLVLVFKSIRQQGGIKLDDADHNITEEEDEGSKQDLEEEEILLKQQKEIAAKKEKEDLWAAFKRDTGMMASNSSKATLSEMVRSYTVVLNITKKLHFFAFFNKSKA